VKDRTETPERIKMILRRVIGQARGKILGLCGAVKSGIVVPNIEKMARMLITTGLDRSFNGRLALVVSFDF
jgi:hypothetical protein